MAYDNTNKGAVWPNKDREKETHPHWKGNANIDGVEYWVSAWKKADDANPKAPFIKFSFKRKEDRPETPAGPELGDGLDVPF